MNTSAATTALHGSGSLAVALKLAVEAEAAGLELTGSGRDKDYREYRWLSCWHSAEYKTGDVRKGLVRCQQCLYAKLAEEAKAAGLELVGPGRSAGYRAYRWLSCWHSAEYRTGDVRKGLVRCQQCLDTKLVEEGRAAGLELTGPGRDCNRRAYRWLSCGHTAEYRTGDVRKGLVRCQQCLYAKLVEEGRAAGLELVRPGRDCYHRAYRWLSCGHTAEYQTGDVREGEVRCQQCNSTAWTKPSQAYLLRITAPDGFVWLKFGTSKRPDTRAKDYGLPEGCRVDSVVSTAFETGKAATEYEKAWHSALKSKRLPVKQMRQYMTSGFSECYPADMQAELLAMITERWLANGSDLG